LALDAAPEEQLERQHGRAPGGRTRAGLGRRQSSRAAGQHGGKANHPGVAAFPLQGHRRRPSGSAGNVGLRTDIARIHSVSAGYLDCDSHPMRKPMAKQAATPAKKAAAPQATITLKQIAADLAQKHEMSKKQAEAVLNDLVATTTRHLKKGDRIRLTGLGILQVRKRAARMGRNPATGEAIKIKASKKIAFRASKELKEGV
jgi:DNA-binding protein HU-beta